MDENIEKVKEFVEINKHSLIAETGIDKEGTKLGKWVQSQRHYYAEGELSKEKIKEFEK